MWDDIDLDKIPKDVRDELRDPRYFHRRHYSTATYAQGCRGPLCRLAETHKARRRTESRAAAEGREYVPRPGGRTDREAELAPIIAWHLHLRGGRGFLSEKPAFETPEEAKAAMAS